MMGSDPSFLQFNLSYSNLTSREMFVRSTKSCQVCDTFSWMFGFGCVVIMLIPGVVGRWFAKRPRTLYYTVPSDIFEEG